MQAAINAARGAAAREPAEQSHLPQGQSGRCARSSSCRSRPTRCRQPRCTTRLDDPGAEVSQIDGRRTGQRRRRRAAGRAGRAESTVLNKYGVSLEQVRTRAHAGERQSPEGQVADETQRAGESQQRSAAQGADYVPLIVAATRTARQCGWPTSAPSSTAVEDVRAAGCQRPAGGVADRVIVSPAPTSSIPSIASKRSYRAQASFPPAIDMSRRSWTAPPPSAPRCTTSSGRARRDRPGGPGGVSVPAKRAGDFIPSVAVPLSLIGTFGVMYLSGTASTTCR